MAFYLKDRLLDAFPLGFYRTQVISPLDDAKYIL
jgi:hypothetical protein